MDMDMDDGGMGQRTESDVDLKGLAEKEYSRMKRQYFLMQKNRQSLMEKAGSKSARAEKLVKLLEIQKYNLESDLAAAKSVTNQKKDEETKTRIWKLLQVYEQYKNKVENLNTELEFMERTVTKMTTKFYQAKLKIQAVLGCAVSVGRLDRTIENQETKLHNVRSQYDSLMTENQELKEEIGTKINRRFNIFKQMNRIHKKMTECRRSLNSSVDEALAVYNVWEETASKISFIKDKYKEEIRQHVLEMKEYDRLLFHDLREIRFYSTKNKPRALLEGAVEREERKNHKEVGSLQKEVRRYKEEFMRLEEFDPLQNVDTIIANYKSLEQKNFSCYQQISDFNRESNKLMEEIHALKIELDNLAADSQKRDKMNEQELKKLELSRDTEQQKLDHLQAQLDVTDESIKRIVEAVETFFETAECDTASLQELLGNNTHVTTQNLQQAFNLLEHHIASIQLEKELLTIQKDVETRTTQIPPKAPKIYRAVGGPFEPNIVISGRPELGMEKKDDEEDTLFATQRIPKAIQREHLLAQLRDLGIVSSPKVITASESAANLSLKHKGKGLVRRPKKGEDESSSGNASEVSGEEGSVKSGSTKSGASHKLGGSGKSKASNKHISIDSDRKSHDSGHDRSQSQGATSEGEGEEEEEEDQQVEGQVDEEGQEEKVAPVEGEQTEE